MRNIAQLAVRVANIAGLALPQIIADALRQILNNTIDAFDIGANNWVGAVLAAGARKRVSAVAAKPGLQAHADSVAHANGLLALREAQFAIFAEKVALVALVTNPMVQTIAFLRQRIPLAVNAGVVEQALASNLCEMLLTGRAVHPLVSDIAGAARIQRIANANSVTVADDSRTLVLGSAA